MPSSAVTIVLRFGTLYLPRQLIAEKSNQHLKKSHLVLELHMGPITTGLGEIYQYTLG
jgi:Cu/Ag efflux pump CusA